MIEISEEHKIAGKLQAIENAVKPIIQQLNTNGLPIDIGVVEKIRNQYLEDQKACAENIFSLAGFLVSIQACAANQRVDDGRKTATRQGKLGCAKLNPTYNYNEV